MTLCGRFYSDMNIPIFVPVPVPMKNSGASIIQVYVCTYMVATDAQQLLNVEFFSMSCNKH